MILKAKLIYMDVNGCLRYECIQQRTVAKFENSLLNEGTYPRASSSLSSSLVEKLLFVIEGASDSGMMNCRDSREFRGR